jgi:hypothetical protein
MAGALAANLPSFTCSTIGAPIFAPALEELNKRWTRGRRSRPFAYAQNWPKCRRRWPKVFERVLYRRRMGGEETLAQH